MRSLARVSFAAVLATAVVSAAFAKPPTSGQMEHVTVRKINGKTENSTQIISWSGSKFRIENINGKQKNVVIGDGKKVYFYDPASKSAMASSQSSPMTERMHPVKRLMSSGKMASARGKKTSTEKVGAYNCDIYTMQHPMTTSRKVTSKVWINKDPNFPVEVKSVTSVDGNSFTRTLKSAKPGAKVSDSLFALPKGTKMIKHPPMPMMNPHRPGQVPNLHNPHKK